MVALKLKIERLEKEKQALEAKNDITRSDSVSSSVNNHQLEKGNLKYKYKEKEKEMETREKKGRKKRDERFITEMEKRREEGRMAEKGDKKNK